MEATAGGPAIGSGGGGRDAVTRFLADVFWIDEDTSNVVLVQLLEDCLQIACYGSTSAKKIAFADIVGASTVERNGVRFGDLQVKVYPKISGCRVLSNLNLSLDSKGSRQENTRACELWSKAIQACARGARLCVEKGKLIIPETTGRRFLIYFNPFSGTGKAETLVNNTVVPLLKDAGCSYELARSTEAGFATRHAKEVNLSSIDCILAVSGDGMLFEIVNGVMSRVDRDEALQIPFAIVPCGSGNAVSSSVSYQLKETHHPSNAAFVCVKGKPVDLDVMEIQGNGQKVFSILSLAWGLLAEIDMKSEALRHLGPARFMLCFAQQLIQHQSFPCRLSYLPANEDGSCPCGLPSTECSCLPPISSPEPLSEHWVVNTGNYIIVQPTLQTHLAEACQFRHQSQLSDGRIHVVVANTRCSRSTLCQLVVEMGHLKSRIDSYSGVTDIPTLAFRIEPTQTDDGGFGPYHLAIDGEPFPYSNIQGRVHPGMAKILASFD